MTELAETAQENEEVADDSSEETPLAAGDTGASGTEADVSPETGDPPEGTGVSDPAGEFDDAEYRKALEGLPPEAKAHLDGVLTRKFQAASEGAKKIVAYDKYGNFLDAIETDPRAAITQAAKQLGMDIGAPTAAAPTEPTPSAVEQSLRESLGDEFEPIIPGLAKFFEAQLGPIQAANQHLVAANVKQSAEASLESWGAKHPDFASYEADMSKLAQEVGRPAQMSDDRFLSMLYNHVKSERGASGDQVAATVKRMEAAAGAATSRPSTAPASHVAEQPDHLPSFGEAFDLAKRGVVLEE